MVAIIGLGSLTLNPQLLPFAAETGSSDTAHSDQEQAHSAEEDHGDEDHASEPKNRALQPQSNPTKKRRKAISS